MVPYSRVNLSRSLKQFPELNSKVQVFQVLLATLKLVDMVHLLEQLICMVITINTILLHKLLMNNIIINNNNKHKMDKLPPNINTLNILINNILSTIKMVLMVLILMDRLLLRLQLMANKLELHLQLLLKPKLNKDSLNTNSNMLNNTNILNKDKLKLLILLQPNHNMATDKLLLPQVNKVKLISIPNR